jgi:UV DNA damage endonuclease
MHADLVPFAPHPICRFDWQDYFRNKLEEIGIFIRTTQIRISMHPDQFTLINSVKEDIFGRSILGLSYHAQVLDLMRLEASANIQIHVGGFYGNKEKSMRRFVGRYFQLDDSVTKRLVIENDDKLYSLRNCLKTSAQTNFPVIFDVFHHGIHNSKESTTPAFESFACMHENLEDKEGWCSNGRL